MSNYFPLHLADFYKVSHYRHYPEGTNDILCNFTPRSAKLAKMLPDFDNKVVFFGLQGTIQTLFQEIWNKNFFEKPLDEVIAKYKRRLDGALGPDKIDMEHIKKLHNLGYLPLLIKALPEGSRVNIGVPVLTVQVSNAHKEDGFGWLVTYIETQLSAELWKKITDATIAYEYRRLLVDYAIKTGSPLEFVDWQGHDFSARGMSGIADFSSTGAGHLLSFLGTDTISAIDYLEDYYGAANTFVGGSVEATEHSAMVFSGRGGEFATFERLIDQAPTGIISLVSDGFDYWKVLTEYLPKLKDKILARVPDAFGNAKVVIRPDSGDPVDIVCGNDSAPEGSPERKGSVEILWEIFGGSISSTGHKILNPRIGLIYGDSITLERSQAILSGLEEKGFASCNIVEGIGSFSVQFVTRDTFGFAYKATSGVVNGIRIDIQKDPATDSGAKKSACGLLRVTKESDNFILHDRQTITQESEGELVPVFENGKLLRFQTLEEIRKLLKG